MTRRVALWLTGPRGRCTNEKARVEGSLCRWNLYPGRGGQMGRVRLQGQAFYPGSPGSSPGRST